MLHAKFQWREFRRLRKFCSISSSIPWKGNLLLTVCKQFIGLLAKQKWYMGIPVQKLAFKELGRAWSIPAWSLSDGRRGWRGSYLVRLRLSQCIWILATCTIWRRYSCTMYLVGGDSLDQVYDQINVQLSVKFIRHSNEASKIFSL